MRIFSFMLKGFRAFAGLIPFMRKILRNADDACDLLVTEVRSNPNDNAVIITVEVRIKTEGTVDSETLARLARSIVTREISSGDAKDNNNNQNLTNGK